MRWNNFLFFIFIISFVLSSCTQRPKEVLKSSEMTEVLVDIHIADGLFETNEYKLLSDEEKINYYNSILAKHNITLAAFDSSLVWYSNDPKRLEKVYNKVISQLTTYEEDVKNGKYLSLVPKDTLPHFMEVNIWNQSVSLEYKKNKKRNLLYFSIKDTALMYEDTYLLTFRQRIEPADSCPNQRATLYIHYTDGNKDSIYKNLHTDGKLRRYTLKIQASHIDRIDSLSGFLLMSDSCPAIPQSSYMDSISLIRTYNPSIQDEIINKIESKKALQSSDLILLKPVKTFQLFPY